MFRAGVRSNDTQTNAEDCVNELFLKGERKRMVPIALRAPASGADRIQNFSTYSPLERARVQEGTVELKPAPLADSAGLMTSAAIRHEMGSSPSCQRCTSLGM